VSYEDAMGARTISPKPQIHEHPGGTALATCSDGVFLQHAGGPRIRLDLPYDEDLAGSEAPVIM
jgi:hypothetical protein